MIKIIVNDIEYLDEETGDVVHNVSFLLGGKDPKVNITVPCHFFDETMRSVVQECVSNRTYQWEHEVDNETSAKEFNDAKEKSKIRKQFQSNRNQKSKIGFK